MMRLALIFAAALFFMQSAFSAPLHEARALLENGQFDQAISLARADGTPQGLVLASETLSTKVMLGYTDNANDNAQLAREWAEEAKDIMPGSQEAMVQYALAYGIEARTSSTFRAWRKKLPQKSREIIDTYRAAYPDDPRGDALLGGWHLGIVLKAGEKNGAKWYDADTQTGLQFYEAALENSSHDILIVSNFVITLLALDNELYAQRASALIENINAATAKNALERDIQSRMSLLKDLMKDKDAVTAAAIKMLEG